MSKVFIPCPSPPHPHVKRLSLLSNRRIVLHRNWKVWRHTVVLGYPMVKVSLFWLYGRCPTCLPYFCLFTLQNKASQQMICLPFQVEKYLLSTKENQCLLFFFLINLFLYFFKKILFCLPCRACGILGPQSGSKAVPPALEALSLNNWTAREVSIPTFLSPNIQCRMTWHLKKPTTHFRRT